MKIGMFENLRKFKIYTFHNYQGAEQAQRVGRLLLTQIEMSNWQQLVSNGLSGECCSNPVDRKSRDRKEATPMFFGTKEGLTRIRKDPR
ncbi:MAG: hypothetical protein AAF502_05780 [Bacteroidota bacterium]